MKPNDYLQDQVFASKVPEIYRLRIVESLTIPEIMKKIGCSRSTIYRALSIFEAVNPKLSETMKKQGQNVKPDDYKKLLEEIAKLKKNLAHERLRADFYEEMVTFGKEVYGIDLKKVGTK